MQNISNIIFDLGGIFINLDFSKTENTFKELGLPNFSEYFNQHYSSQLFADLEMGKIDEEEFYSCFRQTTGLNLTNSDIQDAWNAMLLDFPLERLNWLKDISQKYKVYLFSNTNSIHYQAFQKIFQQYTGMQSFNDYFIKAYYSHTLGMRKPDPASFKYILAKEDIKAEETLFIDDTQKNIEGAKQVGLHTIHMQSPDTVCDLQL